VGGGRGRRGWGRWGSLLQFGNVWGFGRFFAVLDFWKVEACDLECRRGGRPGSARVDSSLAADTLRGRPDGERTGWRKRLR